MGGQPPLGKPRAQVWSRWAAGSCVGRLLAGEQHEEVLAGELGISTEDLAVLAESHVIGRRPAGV